MLEHWAVSGQWKGHMRGFLISILRVTRLDATFSCSLIKLNPEDDVGEL